MRLAKSQCWTLATGETSTDEAIHNPSLHLTNCVATFCYARVSNGLRLQEAFAPAQPFAGELAVIPPRPSSPRRMGLEQLARFQPNQRFLVHNGYSGWSYGTPQDAVVISFETARWILGRIEMPDEQLLDAVQRAEPPPLRYAEEGSELYECDRRQPLHCVHRPCAVLGCQSD